MKCFDSPPPDFLLKDLLAHFLSDGAHFPLRLCPSSPISKLLFPPFLADFSLLLSSLDGSSLFAGKSPLLELDIGKVISSKSPGLFYHFNTFRSSEGKYDSNPLLCFCTTFRFFPDVFANPPFLFFQREPFFFLTSTELDQSLLPLSGLHSLITCGSTDVFPLPLSTSSTLPFVSE